MICQIRLDSLNVPAFIYGPVASREHGLFTYYFLYWLRPLSGTRKEALPDTVNKVMCHNCPFEEHMFTDTKQPTALKWQTWQTTQTITAMFTLRNGNLNALVVTVIKIYCIYLDPNTLVLLLSTDALLNHLAPSARSHRNLKKWCSLQGLTQCSGQDVCQTRTSMILKPRRWWLISRWNVIIENGSNFKPGHESKLGLNYLNSLEYVEVYVMCLLCFFGP